MTQEALERANILELRIKAIELTIQEIKKEGQVYFQSRGSIVPAQLVGDLSIKVLTDLTLTFLNSQLIKYKNEFNSL